MKYNRITIAMLSIVVGASLSGCGGGGEEETVNNRPVSTSPTNITFASQSIATNEGDKGERKTVTVNLRLSKVHNENISLNYVMEEDNEFASGRYESASGTTQITAGTREQRLEFTILGNDRHEDTGRVSVNFSLTGNPSNVNLTQNKATIVINDDDSAPVVQLNIENIDVREGVGKVDIKATLDRPSYKEVTANLSFDGLASVNDYEVTNPSIIFKSDEISSSTSIDIFADDIIEGSETIEVALQSVVNGSIGGNNSMRVIILGDLKLTDTGVTLYYNNGEYNSNMPDAAHGQQDADFGLDTNANFNTRNGLGGLSYNKIDDAGNALGANDNAHQCVYDAHTGLSWEIKGEYFYHQFSEDPSDEEEEIEANYTNRHFNNRNGRYMWYEDDNKLNGGSKGGANNKELEAPILASQACMFPNRDSPLYISSVTQKGCTSDKYEELINKTARCGFVDWRLPTINELQSLVVYQDSENAHDMDYFPESDEAEASHTASGFVYLSSTPSIDNEASVWCLDTSERRIKLCNKRDYHHIRLVRGSQF